MRNDIVIDNKFSYDFNYLKNPKIFGELLLYQCGELYCDNGAEVIEHVHDDFFELTFIVSGTGVFYAAGVPTQVKANDLFLSLPYESHKILSDSDQSLRYYYIAFSFAVDSVFRTDILYNEHLTALAPDMRVCNAPDMADTFVKLLTTLESIAPYSDLEFELQAKLLSIRLFHTYQNMYSEKYASPTVNNEQNLYYKIMHYIDKHLVTMTKLTDIADDLHYNYIYISRIFKRKFGSSIYNYYSNKKLHYAKQLLEEKNMTVTEVANYLNYSSIYVFSRTFKKKYGVSPQNFKQMAQRNQEEEEQQRKKR